MKTKDKVRIFQPGQIERISKIIAETGSGLTGSEIGYQLNNAGIPDVDPHNTKWKRLYNALISLQNTNRNGNHILSFISKALEPSRFLGNSKVYKSMISDLNAVLVLIGLEYRDDGKFHSVISAKTFSEAEKRAHKLKTIIEERNLHPSLIEYCKEELLNDNYFHAVLESVKGLASFIRNKTGLTSDGADLIDAAFSGSNPILKINPFHLESEKSEQRGFVNLMKGLFGTFRNPVAHAAKIEWVMEEEDAFDLFTMTSYAYRRIERIK